MSIKVQRRKLDKSRAHYKEAVQHLPLGVSSNFRFWGEDETVFVKHGKGARLWDLDGNEYIDYRLGYGPAILGHCHPEVDAAARDGQHVGTVFALGTEKEVTVAKLIKEMMLEGVISILEGMNPRMIETKLRTFLFDSKPAKAEKVPA